MGALVVIENIVIQLNKQREELKDKWNGNIGVSKIQSLFDFTHIPTRIAAEDQNDKYRNSLFDALRDTIENSYAFIPYVFYNACSDQLIQDHCFTTDGHFFCYKLKPGETIHVEAR
jgi:hypothetical protein